MAKELQAEFDSLKKDYLSLEQAYYKEKACLLKVASTFGTIVDMSPQFQTGYRKIKRLLQNESDLSVERIQEETGNLRSSIFSEEVKTTVETGDIDPEKAQEKHLLEAYKILNKIVIALTDDFYPINDEMKQKADAIIFDYKNGMSPSDFHKATENFLSYIDTLRSKITKDFKYVNKTFLSFFNQVRELEKVLTKELHEEGQTNGFEEFENNIDREVSSIVDSFSIYATINEVKDAVVSRLSSIKNVIAKRKKEERKKSKEAQKRISWLRKRISRAETETQKLTEQADRFREEAIKDGLTGLYNRKAFDKRIAEGLEAFNKGGDSFVMMMFDVDNFKGINDTFGHVAGDKILQSVATALGKIFRKDEFIARYGGDEFAVVIEGLPEKIAHEKVANFKAYFSKMRFSSHKDGDIKIDISAGIASAAKGDNPDEFIHKADAAMYGMKKLRKFKA
jgi:diguanylate cyclase